MSGSIPVGAHFLSRFGSTLIESISCKIANKCVALLAYKSLCKLAATFVGMFGRIIL